MKTKPGQYIDKSNGYIYIYKPKHPNAKADGCIALHRYKYSMMKKKGRKLNKNMYVHHKDGNKRNNNLNNLMGENVSFHTAHHNKTRVLKRKRARK